MPIVSRTLESVQPTTGGIFASFLCIDGKGREWRRSRVRFVDQVTAQAAVDAFDWSSQLRDREEADAVVFIEAGNSPGSFVKTDLTSTQFNRRLAKRFAQAVLDGDRKLLCNAASWVSSFTAIQIANALGISNARATAIRNRAIDLRDNVCPALVTDDGRVEVID